MALTEKKRPVERFLEPRPRSDSLLRAHVPFCACVVLALVRLWPGHNQARDLRVERQHLAAFQTQNSSVSASDLHHSPLVQVSSWWMKGHKSLWKAPLWGIFRFSRRELCSWPGELVSCSGGAREPAPYLLRNGSTFGEGLRETWPVGEADWKKRPVIIASVFSFLLIYFI